MDLIIVAMADSIHTARWITQFSDQNISILLFPSTPHRRIHQGIKDLIGGKQKMQVTLAPSMRFLALPLTLSDTILRTKFRSSYLRFLIRKYRPQIIHGLETQHGGYLIANSIIGLDQIPLIFLSIWGSDLVWFGKFKKHRRKITEILTKVDYLGVECLRDVEMAKSLGFNGKLLPVIPASGGINIESIDELGPFMQTSRRHRIMVKGYSGFVGRSITALNALEMLSNELKSYEIHIYSASFKTMWRARHTIRTNGLNIICHKKHSLSHSAVISLFGESRLSLSVSLSDGFSGSLRESMATGCFPIESMNSCGSEWTDSGKSALFINPLEIDEIVTAIRSVLTDDSLVDSAAVTNREIVEGRFSSKSVEKLLSSYYVSENRRE
jgi:hypothetical protein